MPSWCRDFDDGEILPKDNDGTVSTGIVEPGELSLDSNDTRSPHYALLATVPSGVTSSKPAYATCGKMFSDVQPAEALFEFDVLVEAGSADQSTTIAAWKANANDNGAIETFGLFLNASTNPSPSAALYVEENFDNEQGGRSSRPHHTTGPRLVQGVWSRVMLRVTFRPTTEVEAFVDGQSAIKSGVDPLLARTFFEHRATIGFSATYGDSAWAVRYDNVVVRLK